MTDPSIKFVGPNSSGDDIRLLTVDETARVLRVSRQRVYELARSRLLPAVRIGRQLRFELAKLHQWIEKGGQPLPGGWKRTA